MEQVPSCCKNVAGNTGIKLEPLEVSLQPQIDLRPKIQTGIIIATTADVRRHSFLPIHPVWLTDPSGPPQDSHAICVKALGFCGCHEFSVFPTIHTHQVSLDLATVISAAYSHREKCLFYRLWSQLDGNKRPASASEQGRWPNLLPSKHV